MLPQPHIHYEVLKKNPQHHLLRHLTEGEKEAIIRDPLGTTTKFRGISATPSTLYNILRATALYEKFGQQVVVVGPRMQAAFEHTSIEEVPLTAIKFPHPCFYLATPGSKLKLWGGSTTGWHAIAGVYVYEEPSVKGLFSAMVWGEANEKSLEDLDDATFWFNLDFEALLNLDTQKGLETALDTRYTADQVQHAKRYLETEAKALRLESALSLLMSDPTCDISDAPVTLSEEEDHVMERQQGELKKLLRVIINTMLYLTSASAETEVEGLEGVAKVRKDLESALARKKHKKGRSAKKLQKSLSDLKTYQTTWVGPTIERHVGGPNDLTQRSPAGHIRRGHWHKFRVGPKKVGGVEVKTTDRSLILKWLPPLWVGEKIGAGVSESPRTYRIQE
jgi:hypothetical protein